MNLFISFSGGRTSGYMTKLLLDAKFLYENIVVVFANTGQEREETLEFVHRCDVEFGFNTVWIEAVVHQGRVACTYRIVNYDTASRNGEPFEEMISKYGLPNKSYPHCTRELKLNPMISYIESLGWEEYVTAIGIREDEPRRISKLAEKNNIIYPLVDSWPSDKQDVNDFWEEQSFDLRLEEHQGNCKWCFKKSTKKHIRLIHESPEIFNFPRDMELKYDMTGNGSDIRDIGARKIFRGYRSTDDLFKLANVVGVANVGSLKDDSYGGCSESCEPDFIGDLP